MPGLLVKDGRLQVRNGRLVVGQCSSCCDPMPGEFYVAYMPCETGCGGDCGFSEPPFEGPIYVSSALRCSVSGNPIFNNALEVPHIRWGGWCWYPLTTPQGCRCFTLTGAPPTGGCLGGNLGVCKLPDDAVGPAGPTVACTEGCGDPSCCVDEVVFPEACPGLPATPPNIYVCLRDLQNAIQSGTRCPTYGLTAQSGQTRCFYFDFTNAFPVSAIPAGATRFFPPPSTNSCCDCLKAINVAGANLCTTAINHRCIGTGQPPVVDRCCAHAINGRSFVVFEGEARIVTSSSSAYSFWNGYAVRANGVVTGAVTYQFGAGPPQTEMFSRPSTGEFSVIDLQPPVAWAGWPCPLIDAGFGGIQVNRSSGRLCTAFSSEGYQQYTLPGPFPSTHTNRSTVRYFCDPRPGICAEGCDTGPIVRPPSRLPDITGINPSTLDILGV